MRNPALRVTKWLGDIPVAAECTSCVAIRFEVNSTSHRPTREEYQKSLQNQFDAHLRKFHSRPDARQTVAPNVIEPSKDMKGK